VSTVFTLIYAIIVTQQTATQEKPAYNPDKVQVIGISADSVEKQKAFVEKYKLTVRFCRLEETWTDMMRRQYPILSDEKGEARKAYGVGKGMLGLGDARVTFVIDGKGVVR
jgi:thioredoxin-dependent peroxiredoxin